MGITKATATGVVPRPASEGNRADQALPHFASAPAHVALRLSVEIARLLNTDLAMAPLLKQAAELIRAQLGCAGVGIYRSEASGTTLQLVAHAGDVTLPPLPQASAEVDPLILAVRQRKAILRTARTAGAGEDDGAPMTHLVLPLTVAEKPFGALAVSTSQASALSQETIAALQALAQHLCIGRGAG